ncbi:Lin1244/Lin1753 domain-containing protein [Bacteroides oleiciplenus]|nr:Lin1244/Lin1753 domain-containing protein [Bacteroides oleiciplenus]
MDSYLIHDANAGNNFKIMMMIQKEGMKGYGIYWMILEFLRLQEGYKADLRVLPILAQKMRVTVATLKRFIYESGLFRVDDTTFSSPGLTRRMGPLEAKREANRESGRRGGLANQQKIRQGMQSDALAINKTNKINNSPSISPQGETEKNEEILLVPPEYALDKQTHNYEGLMEELKRQKVTVVKEINAILRLTDFGKLKGKIWKILYDINNSPQMKARIVMPGKYILKLLQN